MTKKERQANRWVAHYLVLCATQNVVTDTAMNVFQMCVMEELDALPTVDEFCNLALTRAMTFFSVLL